MNLKEKLEALFETEIEDGELQEVVDIDPDEETPALVACEAARGIMENLEDEPQYVVEIAGGMLVSGNNAALLITPDGGVVAKSLDLDVEEEEEDDDDDDDDFLDLNLGEDDDDDDDFDEDDEDDDDDLDLDEEPEEVTTSGLVGGFRGAGFGANGGDKTVGKPGNMGAYGTKGKLLYQGKKRKKNNTTIESLDEDERLEESARLQMDYGTVSLKVDPYNIVEYPDTMNMKKRDSARNKVEDALLMAVLQAKPAFETMVKKYFKQSGVVKQYNLTLKEGEEVLSFLYEDADMLDEFAADTLAALPLAERTAVITHYAAQQDAAAEDYLGKLKESVEAMVVDAARTRLFTNESAEIVRSFEEACEEGDAERAADAAKALAEHWELDEKLLPIPPIGKEPGKPYNTNHGKGKAGSISRIRGGGQARFSFEDADIDNADQDELPEMALSLLGDVGAKSAAALPDRDAERYKKMMTAIHTRHQEFLGQTTGSIPAMKLEHDGDSWSLSTLWTTGDKLEAEAVARTLDIKIVDEDGNEIPVPEEAEEDKHYAFQFPKKRLSEFLELAGRAGADSDASVVVEGDQISVVLDEDVTSKVRPFFKGEDVHIEEAVLETA